MLLFARINQELDLRWASYSEQQKPIVKALEGAYRWLITGKNIMVKPTVWFAGHLIVAEGSTIALFIGTSF